MLLKDRVDSALQLISKKIVIIQFLIKLNQTKKF